MAYFKAVIFDYDGTLFDTRPAIIRCIQRTFEEFALAPPPLDAIARTVGRGLALQDTFVILDASLRADRAALHERVKTYRTIYLDESAPLIQPYAGVGEALQRLHEDGIKCLVVSNKGLVAVRRSLEQNGLAIFVDMIFADAPGLPRKPDPAVLTDHILPRYPQLASRHILMVGDTETDILFAKATGMSCCWVSYGFGEAERCRALEPEHEIAALAELAAVVSGRAATI